MATNWKEYQEEAAAFFRSLGLDAETDVTVKGVRTSHDIDVLVKSHHVGFDVTWIVECKHWATKVSKLHVLALREVVADVGADRGILLSESGFQSGAIEAATLTNIHVTSILETRRTAKSDITAMRLRELYDRVETCKEQYWDIPKQIRIKCDLRQEVGVDGYSGFHVLNLADDVFKKAFRGTYPIETDVVHATILDFPPQLASADALLEAIEPIVEDFEERLKAAKSFVKGGLSVGQ